ncbi:hypothetical protein FRC00_006323 [Tulasnella sp. 408]|nr:hypothetical protein FRC00_006323 [Tulasnella sp. 408]
MLPNEFKLGTTNRNAILSEMDTPTATKSLNNQLHSYIVREYPFADGLQKGETPLEYWKRKEQHSQAGILANSPEALALPPRPIVRFRDLAPERRSQARPMTNLVPKPPNETLDKAKEVDELPKGAEAIEDADAEEVTDHVEEKKGSDSEKTLKLIPADAWLDEPSEDLPGHLDRKKFVAKDLVNLKSHKLSDLLSMTPREALAEDDDDNEARATLSHQENRRVLSGDCKHRNRQKH